MSSIEWKRLDQPRFDRVVEAFYSEENSDIPSEAYAVNGRGGDEGIDIHIRRDGRLTILQLKFFPEGFSNGFKPRRNQILDSFKAALKHNPDEWHLVVPTTLTADERRYVVGLPKRQRPKLLTPDVKVIDQTKLDGLASRHLNLVTYFKRDELREAAKDYNVEMALLRSRDDVVARVKALVERSDTLDPDWRLELFMERGMVGTMLVPKHPRAAEVSPVTLTIRTAFDGDHADLRQSFDTHVSFETPGLVTLPSHVVSSFVVDGPEFIAKRSENVEIRLESDGRGHESLPVSLLFRDPDGELMASFVGKSTWRTTGARGASLRAVFHDSVTLMFLLPFDRSEEVTMKVMIALGGSSPADVVAAIDLLELIEQAPGMGVEIDGMHLAGLENFGQGASPFGEHRDEILRHREVAMDLVVIEGATRRRFLYPDDVDFDDLVRTRFLRLLLEGHCVVIPGQRQFTPVLSGEDGPGLRHVLTGNDVSLAIEMEDFPVMLFGQMLHVGNGRVYAPQVHALDPEVALAAVEAGTSEGHELILRAPDGWGFWAYLQDVHADPDGVLRPASLGIIDYPDAPDVTRALEAAAAPARARHLDRDAPHA